MESIDDTLDLLAKAKALAERIKAREEEQLHDKRALERVLRLLGASGGGAFDPGVQLRVGPPAGPPPTKAPEVTFPSTTSFVSPDATRVAISNVVRAIASAHLVPNTPPGVPQGDVTDEPAPKYDLVLQLIASGRFDVGMAARAIYGDDSERSRNRVRAGVNHLRDRGLVVRHADGTLSAVRRKPIPSAEAFAGKREG